MSTGGKKGGRAWAYPRSVNPGEESGSSHEKPGLDGLPLRKGKKAKTYLYYDFLQGLKKYNILPAVVEKALLPSGRERSGKKT